MNFRIFLISFILLPAFSLFSQKYEEELINGKYQTLIKEEVTSYQMEGFLQLNESRSAGLLRVDGSLLANHSLIDKMEINGQAYLNECVMNGDSIVRGEIHVDRSVFKGNVTTVARDMSFTHCLLQSIRAKKAGSYKGQQVLVLKEGTVVEGDITFESGNGEVHLCPESIVKGRINGAIVKEIKPRTTKMKEESLQKLKKAVLDQYHQIERTQSQQG